MASAPPTLRCPHDRGPGQNALGACATATLGLSNVIASCTIERMRNGRPIYYGSWIESIIGHDVVRSKMPHHLFVLIGYYFPFLPRFPARSQIGHSNFDLENAGNFRPESPFQTGSSRCVGSQGFFAPFVTRFGQGPAARPPRVKRRHDREPH